MSKVYRGQPLTVQADCLTDVSTGTPTLQLEFLYPDTITKLLVTAALVSASTTAITADLTGAQTEAIYASATGTQINDEGYVTMLCQPVITDGANPPWRGDTFEVRIYDLFR